MPPPTTIQWNFPKAWDTDGGGFERLEPFASVTMTWNLLSFDDFSTLYDAWVAITGTATVYLPSSYGDLRAWLPFSNVIVDQPRPENAMTDNWYANVKMNIRKVRILRADVLP